MDLYFSDVFHIDQETIEDYGAFNISLVNDLPLFVDPFLLFNSDKEAYQGLHSEIIRYLRFLKNISESGSINERGQVYVCHERGHHERGEWGPVYV